MSLDLEQAPFDNENMYRVLLVIDDYNELVYLQTLLKKLGFDVEGIQKQKKFEDMKLGFNPQMIIASAKGRSVNGFEIAEGIKKNKMGQPALLLLQSVGQSVDPSLLDNDNIDSLLDSPVNIHKLIQALAEHSDQDEQTLLEKYAKMKGVGEAQANNQSSRSAASHDQDKEEVQVVHSDRIKQSTMTKSQRRERFESYLSKMSIPTEKSYFPRDRIISFNKSIRSAAKPEDNQDLEEARRSFVKALFKK